MNKINTFNYMAGAGVLQGTWDDPSAVGGGAYALPGTIRYVDSVNGSDMNTGADWENALATLDAAIGKCTANNGDVIILAPWHAESETAAVSIVTADIAGITIKGLRQGGLVPTFTLGNASAVFTVSAALRLMGVKIISDVADCAMGLSLGAAADGSIVENCILTDGAAAKELVIGINVAAACDNIIIRNNRFYTVPAGGCASAIKLVGESAQSILSGNRIQGDYSVSCIDGATALSTLLTIADNYMINIDTTAGGCIVMHSNTTGMTCNNRMMSGHSMANSWIAAGMVSIENYATGAVSASGLVEPGVDGD